MKKQLIIQVGIKLLALGISVVIPRWLNDNLTSQERSLFTTISAISMFVAGWIEFGLPKIVQKYFTNNISEIQNQKNSQNFWTTIWVVRLASLIVAIPMLLLGSFVFGITDITLLFALFLTQFILVCDQKFRSLFDSRGKGYVFSTTDLVAKLFLITSLFWVVNKGFGQVGIWAFVWSALFAYSFGLLLDWIYSRTIVKSGKFDWLILKQNYKQIGLLTIASFVATIYVRGDILYLNWFKVNSDGINSYDNAFKLYEVATVAPGILVPAIASKLKQNIDQAIDNQTKKTYLKKYILFCLVFGVVCAFGTWIFGGFGLWLLGASQKYPLSVQYLQVLALSIVVVPTVTLFSNLFVFFGHEKIETRSIVIIAVFSILSYSLLVSHLGGMGASLANVSLLFFDFSVKSFFFWKYIWRKLG
jgi:O-antigen/teichoic acid export membrane protein